MANLRLGKLFTGEEEKKGVKRRSVYILDIVVFSWKKQAWSYVRQVVVGGAKLRGEWFIPLLIHLLLDFCFWLWYLLGWDCLFVCAVLSPVALSFWGGMHSHPNTRTGSSQESFRDLQGKVMEFPSWPWLWKGAVEDGHVEYSSSDSTAGETIEKSFSA